jgi:acetate kinase
MSIDGDEPVDSRDPRVISPAGAEVAVLVVPTDEELEMAEQAAALVLSTP